MQTIQRFNKYAMLFAVCGLLISGGSEAGVYRWVDKQGVVHYSDRAVASGAQTVELHNSGTIEREPELAPASPPPAASADDGRTAEVRAQQCAKAKQQLASYRGAQKILLTEPDGKKRELTADEQVREIVRAEKRVDALCGGGA